MGMLVHLFNTLDGGLHEFVPFRPWGGAHAPVRPNGLRLLADRQPVEVIGGRRLVVGVRPGRSAGAAAVPGGPAVRGCGW
jgi:hypothetical protein